MVIAKGTSLSYSWVMLFSLCQASRIPAVKQSAAKVSQWSSPACCGRGMQEEGTIVITSKTILFSFMSFVTTAEITFVKVLTWLFNF